MSLSAPASNLGRHLFGVAVAAWGLITLAWHDGTGFVYALAVAEMFGGAALQFRRTAKTGALVIGVVFFVFAVLCVPRIVAAPRIYNTWGNFFEQFSLVAGAAIVYARLSSACAPELVHRVGRILVGICAASFALEQALYLDNTAILVPKWLPPSQMFWAITTTVAFALAALAILANQRALLATRLLTAMLVLFGLLIWVPLVLAHPGSHSNWSEFAETFAIAGVAWILADLLGEAGVRPDLSLPQPQ